ncbi:hypothetical protein PHMEG_00027680, partial [Phytophthora megakarya]
LVKWQRDRRDYEDKLRARCRVSGEEYAAVVESVVQAFDPELLDVFCSLKLQVDADTVTDEVLITEIKGIVNSVKNNTLPDIKALFGKELKMRMNESDVEARVLDYFKLFNKNVKDNGLTECFGGAEQTREKSMRLMASLTPVSLKQEVKQCCKEMHWLRDDTKATEDEKVDLLKQLREARKVKKARTKRLGEMLPSDDRMVTINGVLELPFCPDSGLDYTVISRGHWEQLKLVDTSVKAKKLTNPVRTQTFGATWVTAEAKVNLHVLIHTAAGPVEPMSTVEVLIVDVDDDEFIVGNDLLTLLGIDVNRQLEQLAGRGEDETSGDPIELEADDMPIGPRQLPPSDEIFAAVEKLVDRAVENGFPVDKVEQLRTIVHAYDVWRLDLLADPPANVPPLEVRLQNGAQPTKGLVFENPGSRWSSPVLPVKKSSDILDLRQTTDYRAVNDKTLVMAAVMPIIYDLLLYAEDLDTYLDKLSELFSLFNEFGLKLNANKSSLYEKEVKWCVRILNGSGVRHDPSRIDSFRSMPYLTTAAELQQFVCAINWMRESIVDFARNVAPLQKRLDVALATTKRTRRAAAGIGITLSVEERQAFDTVKDMLATSATLDFPDDTATTCLFTDTSDVGWALIVTQVASFDPKIPATEQQHRLLHCMSGTFTGSQCNWTVIEKEALPIVIACDKLDYLLLRPKPFRMYCDHRNLIHVFAPHESVKKHIKGKLFRWSMKLMNFRYVVEYVPGPDNVWADMISRWAGNHPPAATLKRLKVVGSCDANPATPPTIPVPNLRPLDDANFIWPTFEEFISTQAGATKPVEAERETDSLVTVDGRVWVPSEAKDLLQRLCIISHCGAQGHRGQQTMCTHLRRLFAIDNISTIVTRFVGQCLLCQHSKGGMISPLKTAGIRTEICGKRTVR